MKRIKRHDPDAFSRNTIRLPSPSNKREEGGFEYRPTGIFIRPGYAKKLLKALIEQGIEVDPPLGETQNPVA